MKKADIHEFFSRLRARDPEPTSDLEWSNPFTLLVAVVLSAQATDEGVNHGRYTCKARTPLCEKCIVYDLCNSKDKKAL